jgi:hypothetical protein
MGTHCLENFFGLVRRASLDDDRYVVGSRIIAKTSLASDVMHDLDLSITHRGHDNVGGILISGCRSRFGEGEAERLFRSLIRMSSLESSPAMEMDLLPLDELRYILSGQSREDDHPNDPASRAHFVSKPSNAHIPIPACLIPSVVIVIISQEQISLKKMSDGELSNRFSDI